MRNLPKSLRFPRGDSIRFCAAELGADIGAVFRKENPLGAEEPEKLPLLLPGSVDPGTIVHKRDEENALGAAQISNYGCCVAEGAGLGSDDSGAPHADPELPHGSPSGGWGEHGGPLAGPGQ